MFFIVALPIGFILVILFRGYDTKLENYYKETVLAELRKPGYLPKTMSEAVPEEIIVDSRRAYTPLRVFLKKIIARALGKEIPEVFVVFGVLSEVEQKAFLIQKAFSSGVTSPLLDLDFIETLIYYLAHKYASANPLIEAGVVAKLRRDFETSNYRDCILKLDSLEYSEKIVLNPPPLKKPLLTNVVFPMVKEQEKKLLSGKREVAEIETWKYLFMRVITGFCAKTHAVLFVARRNIEEYANMILECLQDFDSIVISARGHFVEDLLNVIRLSVYTEKSMTPEECVFTSCEREEIDGVWEFPDEEIVLCRWIIFTKT